MLYKYYWKYTVELVLLNGCKSKRKIWKKLDMLGIPKNLSTFYVDKEMWDIMKIYDQIKRNLRTSTCFFNFFSDFFSLFLQEV